MKVGGKFSYRMEAKDQSMGFDFEGTYDVIEQNNKIEYSLDDGRKTIITFLKYDNGVLVEETFDADNSASIEMQKAGWQSILDNFKKHTESI